MNNTSRLIISYYYHTGIGTMEVTNVRFNPSFNTLLWDPPVTAGVLSDLSYIVTVVNNNTGDVIVSDTTTYHQHSVSAISDRHSAISKLHTNVTINYGDSAIIGQFPVSENIEVIIIIKHIGSILQFLLQHCRKPGLCLYTKLKICSLDYYDLASVSQPAGAAEQARQTRQPPDQHFGKAD